MKEKPRSSTMLRIPEDLKLMAMYAAHDLGITYNAFCTLAIREKVQKEYAGGAVRDYGKQSGTGETV